MNQHSIKNATKTIIIIHDKQGMKKAKPCTFQEFLLKLFIYLFI